MLYWAAVFFVIALVAALLGFFGVATAAARLSKSRTAPRARLIAVRDTLTSPSRMRSTCTGFTHCPTGWPPIVPLISSCR